MRGNSQRFYPPYPSSEIIAINWSMVFRHSFIIMTGFTKRLPVALIPEQFLISSVRNDMVHHRRLPVTIPLQAPNTEGMKLQETKPSFVPS